MTAAKTTSLTSALLAAQRAMPAIQKDAINPHFRNRYVSLDSLLPPVLAALNEHGIVLSQFPTIVENGGDPKPALRTRLTHESGEFIEDTMLLLAGKDDPQGQGSAITYARRYALMAILGLVADEDDDGQRAARRSAGEPSRTPAASASAGSTADASAGGNTAASASPAEGVRVPKASPGDRDKIRALIKENARAAKAAGQKMTEAQITKALESDIGPIEEMNAAEATHAIDRLTRYADNLAKAATA